MAKIKNFHMVISIALFMMPLCTAASPKDLLAESNAYFDKGQYKNALDVISGLDIRKDLDSSDDMKLAFKIRSIAYVQSGERDKAKETIRELLFLDPTYKFDPFDTPSSVVALAQEEAAAIDEKNKYLATVKTAALNHTAPKEVDQKKKIDLDILNERVPSLSTAFLPLGFNHFSVDAPLKGGLYLSLQTLGLIGNIAAYWWKQSFLEHYGSARLSNQIYLGRFQAAQTIQYIGLAGFLIGYGISVIDALIRLNKTSQTQT